MQMRTEGAKERARKQLETAKQISAAIGKATASCPAEPIADLAALVFLIRQRKLDHLFGDEATRLEMLTALERLAGASDGKYLIGAAAALR
jgi:hypothetical protein